MAGHPVTGIYSQPTGGRVTRESKMEASLAVVRYIKSIQRKQYTVPETSKPPLTRKQKDTLLFLIPRNLTALLSTNELMAGAKIE
jgi:hypothetical protein